MSVYELELEEYADDLTAPWQPVWCRPDVPNVVIVSLDDTEAVDAVLPPNGLMWSTAAVVVGVSENAWSTRPSDALAVDVVASRSLGDLDDIIRQVHACPLASTAFVQLLRQSQRRSLADGLLMESMLYSTLQAGPEFAAWSARHPQRHRREPEQPSVVLERESDILRLTLNRPHVHNALNREMRDLLIEALELAAVDSSVERVELRGAGPSFCAGGDLDEFGSFVDPASAHLVRTTASLGRLLHELSERLTVYLHGACFGSGIELPVFAADVRAGDVRIALPELSLGLIPGAGGTWSIPQRIGRHRTAWMGLTGRTIQADRAVDWALVADDSGI